MQFTRTWLTDNWVAFVQYGAVHCEGSSTTKQNNELASLAADRECYISASRKLDDKSILQRTSAICNEAMLSLQIKGLCDESSEAKPRRQFGLFSLIPTKIAIAPPLDERWIYRTFLFPARVASTDISSHRESGASRGDEPPFHPLINLCFVQSACGALPTTTVFHRVLYWVCVEFGDASPPCTSTVATILHENTSIAADWLGLTIAYRIMLTGQNATQIV